ncbi:MAG TPA: DUF1987 domain-containing protein [Flavobacteriales bacterium]|nr:DUF1987 domain-containing protein [Flavobacteriales bacterium]HRN35707.1 DUF1987 domain-containing protein [Flavobacteriales bacterium]HRO39618.1 DUF1987 domain-containing protein [Flavobacteriales bacterium]HRP81735.1 DUF1987 domain-containing protein [Flavobacteriales bacterium]HRQ84730.1 DUF1987 domain-containing protein [Flavobacteriales bacterium]
MTDLLLDGTPKTPTVNFNSATGLLDLRGRSIPENSIDFYKPLIDWIDEYGRAAKALTQLRVQLEYFNTSSSKCILDLLKKLEQVRNAGHQVEVLWHYELDDEDMMEAGEDYQAIVSLPFRMVQVEEVDGK